MKGFWKSLIPCTAIAILVLSALTGNWGSSTASAHSSTPDTNNNTCQISSPDGNVQHVIYVQFDNVHFTRDNPNVPSDLEQMPHLLNFLESNGTVLTDHHTPLIAHTGNDFLTSLTGVYPDRHGMPISNSYRYYNANGTTSSTSSFAYWTAPVSATNPTYNLLSAPQTNTPAPWVAYTRAGCNFGAAGMANTVLENIGTDIPTVFGANSPEAAEVQSNPGQATSDFVGVAIHCAKNSALCAASNNGRPDVLPSEPGGYNGYQALFGNKYVAPQISTSGTMTDLDGNIIKDSTGHVGFPGFNSMTPDNSLAYVAAMQEHGVPVTYAYLSDAHDNHATGTAYGPGSAGYVAALKTYDNAFAKFFTRLQKDGINSHNTLFVFTSDENDHFVGGAPSPTNCDGITVPCTYSQLGEINANLTGLMATQQNNTTPFTVYSDSAPPIYLNGQPSRIDSQVRTFEQDLGKLTATNPYTGQTEKITNYLADPVEMQLLHLVTADPGRTPTAILFANPNYYLYTGAPNCQQPCVQSEANFAWNHGDLSPDINTTWLGMAGPGVRNLGATGKVWTDHTDIRPTMMALLGLKDDYAYDGRVITEVVDDKVLSPTLRNNLAFYQNLGSIYKQIDAPVGSLALSTLQTSTTALESSSPGDATYTRLENQLQSITLARNAVAQQMSNLLNSAEFGTHTSGLKSNVNTTQLLIQGQQLLNQAHALPK